MLGKMAEQVLNLAIVGVTDPNSIHTASECMIFWSGPRVFIFPLCLMMTSLSLPGLGYGSQVVVMYTGVYYIIILAWAFLYLFSSFKAELPWTSCSNSWNTGINSFSKLLQRQHSRVHDSNHSGNHNRCHFSVLDDCISDNKTSALFPHGNGTSSVVEFWE